MTRDKTKQLIEEIISVNDGANMMGLYERNNMIGWNKTQRKRFHKLLALFCKENGFELIIHKRGDLALRECESKEEKYPLLHKAAEGKSG